MSVAAAAAKVDYEQGRIDSLRGEAMNDKQKRYYAFVTSVLNLNNNNMYYATLASRVQ